jgi:hypothetical protein
VILERRVADRRHELRGRRIAAVYGGASGSVRPRRSAIPWCGSGLDSWSGHSRAGGLWARGLFRDQIERDHRESGGPGPGRWPADEERAGSRHRVAPD